MLVNENQNAIRSVFVWHPTPRADVKHPSFEGEEHNRITQKEPKRTMENEIRFGNEVVSGLITEPLVLRPGFLRDFCESFGESRHRGPDEIKKIH